MPLNRALHAALWCVAALAADRYAETMKRLRITWADIWPFAIVFVMFLVGLTGAYFNRHFE